MKIKRIISSLLALLMLMNAVVVCASAQITDPAKTGGYVVEITSYEQLKNLIYNSPNGEIFVLQNDIIVEDNKNDNEIVVSSFTDCTFDLNGYTLSRSTRGIDNCLITVQQEANISVIDSSEDKTGQMIFSSGNYAGTSSVIIANGYVDIYCGCFEIQTPYEVGGGVVFLVETGYLNIYDGVFDSHTAFGGDTIELRHNAYMYTVPHCNIFGGTFYGKISNFEVSSYGDFASYGCFYPSVYVYDGEFYIAETDNEYAGFAYCNNGWGQVIVAGGTRYYKCLNSSDDRYLDSVSKNSIEVEYDGKTGAYYEITPPTMIGSEDLSLFERLSSRFMKKEVSSYSKNGTVYKTNQEEIDYILGYVDTIEVAQTAEESPLLWVENSDNVKTVSWYFSDAVYYDGENTPWSELGDYAGKVLPFRFDFRPEQETTLYIRCLITMDNGEKVEDVIAIHYEELKPNPPVALAEVTGVDEPVAGAKPDFDVTTGSDAYNINAVYWTDVTTSSHINLKETDVFEAGHTYELQVWLRANDGYKFNVDSDDYVDITATVGGKNAEAIGNELAVILTITYTIEDEELMVGDPDGDGEVTIIDASAVQRHVASVVLFNEKQFKAADTDYDGMVTIIDASNIQRYVAQIITEF